MEIAYNRIPFLAIEHIAIKQNILLYNRIPFLAIERIAIQQNLLPYNRTYSVVW
jgi:hypothetical protein